MQSFQTQTRTITTNGIRLHVETAGPKNGPLVVLLHGFPEFWYGWKNQIGPLAEAGYFVAVPDQRGYNLSDKPKEIAAYRIEELAKDVSGLITAFGRENALVVGHDWGAAVAWHTAIHYPERVEKLAILNVPHPAALSRALSKFTPQVLRSWYIYFFQIPFLPQWLLSLNGYAPARRMLSSTSNPGAFTPEDLRRYTKAWKQPGAMKSMINWYRAAVRGAVSRGRGSYLVDASQRVTMPTLIQWGKKDVALIPQMAEWSLEWCDQGRLIFYPEASHWLQHEEPEGVNTELLAFFKRT